MPVLLEEEARFPLPPMRRVRQTFPRPKLDDPAGALARELARPEIRAKIKPGARVALAVGSRGIRHLPELVKAALAGLKEAGARPFVVSAMGSHGGGTAEGQRQVLAGYGLTEETLGVEIVTSQDVVSLGRTSRGLEVFFDKAALEADLVVPLNRIKLHTDFVADIQSGLCKMLVIGLGKHRGCTAIHEDGVATFGQTLLEAVEIITQKARVGFGLGVVENAYDETFLVEALPVETLVAREKELLLLAKENMPALMIPEIDVLVVEQIGKNISGAGFDPQILGRSCLLPAFARPVPAINRMVLLDLTPETHGNAIGLGYFDVTTRRVFDQLDLESTYANAVAVKCPEDVKIPLIAATEDEAVRVAVQTARGADRSRLRIVKIKNTLDLEIIEVSETLWDYVSAQPGMELL